MTSSINSNSLNFASFTAVKPSDKVEQSSNETVQNDFSWKYGTAWEDVSDDELKSIIERMNNAFKSILSEYDKLTKEMPVRENSIYQQLKNGTADTALINEINKFKNKNVISQFGGIGVGSLLDKDIESIYRTATNADEFKASWLALKEKRSNEVISSVLKNGFGASGVILSNDDIKALEERFASENLARKNAQNAENSAQNLDKKENEKIVIQLSKAYENTSLSNLQQLFHQQSVDKLKLMFGFLNKVDTKI